MRINSIVNRYIIWELIPPFVISLMFFTFIFMMTKILALTDYVVNYGISLFSVILFLIYYMPVCLQYVIPVSVMMSVLLTFLRMSSDNEIIVLKSSGYNIRRLIPPVILFSTIGGLLTSVMTLYGLHWGTDNVQDLMFKVITRNFEIGIKERTFVDCFKGVTLYAGKMDMEGEKKLQDVFIEYERRKGAVMTIVAPEGTMVSDPDNNACILTLKNGIINQANLSEGSTRTSKFGELIHPLDLKESTTEDIEDSMGRRARSIPRLIEYSRDTTRKDYHKVVAELHRRFAVPFACIALGLLVLPVGIQAKTTRKSSGLGIGFGFVLMYYLLLTIGLFFAESGTCPAVIGMWGPNIIVAGIGLYLFKRVADERPVDVGFIVGPVKRFWVKVRKHSA